MTPLKLVIILFLLQLGIFCVVTLRPYTITPPGHTYTQFSKNYFFSIFFYPNMILQAKDGSWGIKDTHTTLPQKQVYAQWFFIFAGKLAALFHINPTVMYVLAQTTGAAFMFAVIYLAVTHFLPKSFHSIALLFAFILELGPSPKYFGQFGTLSSWTPAINDFILLFRHFDIPHHIWGEAVGYISLLLVVIAYQKRSLLRIVGILITTLLSVWFVPSVVVTLWLTVYPVFFLWALFKRNFKNIIIPLTTAFIATAIAGLQTKITFAGAGIPWSLYSEGEKTWVTNASVIQQYLSSLLLYLPFLIVLIILLPFVWKRWSQEMRLIVLLLFAWVMAPFIGVPLSGYSFFPIPNFRLVIGPMYMSAGILSAIGLLEAARLIASEKVRKMVLAAVTGLTIGFSLYISSVYLSSFFRYQNDVEPHAYPATSTWQAMQFLRTVPAGSGVMVREYFGEMLPGFANIRVYIGGQHHFPDWLNRQAAAITFFSGTMSEEGAKQFLKSSDVTYVFYGPDEQSVTTISPLYPDILKPVFQNATVTIFSLKPAP